MRAHAVAEFRQPLVAIDCSDPIPTGTEVVLEVTRCGVCHTDLHLQDGYYDLGGGKRLSLADRGIKPPVVLGHEVLGRLTAKGPDAPIDDAEIGRTFLVYPWIGCGSCEVCRDGQDNLCTAPRSLGVFRPGGYAGQCLVPHPRYLIPVEGIDPTVAATYACSGLTAYSALRKVGIDRERDLLLIIGLGGVGLSAVQIARALGFQRIAGVDLESDKRTTALSQGVTLALDPGDPDAAAKLAQAGGVAAAIDFVGTGSTTELAFASLKKGGTCVVVGLFGGELRIPLPPLVQRAITIRGSYVGSLGELKELVELVRTVGVPPLPVEPIAFDDVNIALDRLRAGGVSGRLVLAR
ncbi:alcohol dehydrogenase [Enterovirga sp. CN4-39]|uniref:alcohol dehydrogenase n=1 Tax=Enterovirga sp. CN4-39 TaxID=3400910 RepID=UPI003BFD5A00